MLYCYCYLGDPGGGGNIVGDAELKRRGLKSLRRFSYICKEIIRGRLGGRGYTVIGVGVNEGAWLNINRCRKHACRIISICPGSPTGRGDSFRDYKVWVRIPPGVQIWLSAGTGRQAGLKNQWAKARVGSSPT